MSAPNRIKQLVEIFEQNIEEYRLHKNETELRRQFLDPFFEALGWDVDNKKGLDEKHKEVAHEFSVEIEGQQKKADYAFRAKKENGGKFDFLVEAKKPSVQIENNLDAAFQIRRYGWSAKIPINILTDFEHLAIYDCRVKPKYGDKAFVSRVKIIHYKEYLERWDEIASIFSPESVRAGSLTEYVKSMKTPKGALDVDDDFLQEIERWREALAKNIAANNDWIDLNALNYAVQMTIDRIVFLRICEERNIESENQLQDIANKDNIYKELFALFKRADTKYNSGLFHFSKESSQASRPDDLTSKLIVDDKVLRDVILNLYYPKSPYAFLYIPADILGQVYERFLGKVIRLTEGHRAKVEEKPEVKKAGGVFYTPTFIVDYIVKNTLGTLLEGLTPKEAANLKLVDPACGSGTFLLEAYQYLLDWHLVWYLENNPQKWASAKSPVIYQSVTYQRKAEEKESTEGRRVIRDAVAEVKGEWRLTTAKKKEILLNNIFGVDIDPQAVEVTKLSLLLKVLEDLNGQLTLGVDRLLPDLGNNIKCGNSLVDEDYFNGFPEMISREERNRVNALSWQEAFPKVFDQGGFDVALGNPPYVRTLLLEENKEYFKKTYRAAAGAYDIYVLFMEKAISIVKQKGLIGLITPNKYFVADYAAKIREVLLSKAQLISITDLGKCKSVFQGALISTAITVYSKNSPDERLNVKILSDDTLREIEKISFVDVPLSQVVTAEQMIQVYADVKTNSLLAKIYKISEKLSAVAEVRTGVMGFDYWAMDKFIADNNKGMRIATNSYVEPYAFLWGKKVNLYKRTVYEPRLNPKCDILSDSTLEFFKSKKIVVRGVARRLTATLDNEGVGLLVAVHGVIGAKYSNLFLLGLLNSKLFNWIHVIQFYSARIPEGSLRYPISFLAGLPIKKIDFKNPAEKSAHDKIVLLAEKMLDLNKRLAPVQDPREKEGLERQVESANKEIDGLTYELYGLTEKEIRMIEEE